MHVLTACMLSRKNEACRFLYNGQGLLAYPVYMLKVTKEPEVLSPDKLYLFNIHRVTYADSGKARREAKINDPHVYRWFNEQGLIDFLKLHDFDINSFQPIEEDIKLDS
jgi:hypothetical protein